MVDYICHKLKKLGLKENVLISRYLSEIGKQVCGEYNISVLEPVNKNYFYFNKAFEKDAQKNNICNNKISAPNTNIFNIESSQNIQISVCNQATQTDEMRCILEPFQQLYQPIQKEINQSEFNFNEAAKPVDESLLSNLKADNILKMENTPYRQLFLFNGDYVNRGGSSFQTLFYLLYM
ncbi:Hypothetical_protein [Hexamita inflata]|uniref:Hypothetical_protein n=1 Tax=Hexamita inflata TaxID=28002 RepID=A0AA86VTV6_9EUKA|nr:Hypothetical protein HINF_LOCUS65613 [Hexamita inflata]